MGTLTLALPARVSALSRIFPSVHEAGVREAVRVLRGIDSRWPSESGESKAAWRVRGSGSFAQIYNPKRYASFVEAGYPNPKTRNLGKQTLEENSGRIFKVMRRAFLDVSTRKTKEVLGEELEKTSENFFLRELGDSPRLRTVSLAFAGREIEFGVDTDRVNAFVSGVLGRELQNQARRTPGERQGRGLFSLESVEQQALTEAARRGTPAADSFAKLASVARGASQFQDRDRPLSANLDLGVDVVEYALATPSVSRPIKNAIQQKLRIVEDIAQLDRDFRYLRRYPSVTVNDGINRLYSIAMTIMKYTGDRAIESRASVSTIAGVARQLEDLRGKLRSLSQGVHTSTVNPISAANLLNEYEAVIDSMIASLRLADTQLARNTISGLETLRRSLNRTFAGQGSVFLNEVHQLARTGERTITEAFFGVAQRGLNATIPAVLNFVRSRRGQPAPNFEKLALESGIKFPVDNFTEKSQNILSRIYLTQDEAGMLSSTALFEYMNETRQMLQARAAALGFEPQDLYGDAWDAVPEGILSYNDMQWLIQAAMDIDPQLRGRRLYRGLDMTQRLANLSPQELDDWVQDVIESGWTDRLVSSWALSEEAILPYLSTSTLTSFDVGRRVWVELVMLDGDKTPTLRPSVILPLLDDEDAQRNFEVLTGGASHYEIIESRITHLEQVDLDDSGLLEDITQIQFLVRPTIRLERDRELNFPPAPFNFDDRFIGGRPPFPENTAQQAAGLFYGYGHRDPLLARDRADFRRLVDNYKFLLDDDPTLTIDDVDVYTDVQLMVEAIARFATTHPRLRGRTAYRSLNLTHEIGGGRAITREQIDEYIRTLRGQNVERTRVPSAWALGRDDFNRAVLNRDGIQLHGVYILRNPDRARLITDDEVPDLGEEYEVILDAQTDLVITDVNLREIRPDKFEVRIYVRVE